MGFAQSKKHCQGRVLVGGAGDYQPFTHTPRIWANVVKEIAERAWFSTCS